MVDALAVTAADWQVTEGTRDVAPLRAFLVGDKERTAYFLPDLEPR
jgi:hypothetical protein